MVCSIEREREHWALSIEHELEAPFTLIEKNNTTQHGNVPPYMYMYINRYGSAPLTRI